jgi:hypothetical protein
MTVIHRLARAALISCLASAACLAHAQGASPSAKQALVQKVLQLQQPAIESLGAALVGGPAQQLMQGARQAMAQVPTEKREALAKETQADIQKFFDANAPAMRERAVKLAPTTIGPMLEERFTEDELKVLVSWLESPVSRKFGQIAPEGSQNLSQKLAEEMRSQMEPKLKALEQTMAGKFNAAIAAGAPAAGAKAAPAPKAAASKK